MKIFEIITGLALIAVAVFAFFYFNKKNKTESQGTEQTEIIQDVIKDNASSESEMQSVLPISYVAGGVTISAPTSEEITKAVVDNYQAIAQNPEQAFEEIPELQGSYLNEFGNVVTPTERSFSRYSNDIVKYTNVTVAEFKTRFPNVGLPLIGGKPVPSDIRQAEVNREKFSKGGSAITKNALKQLHKAEDNYHDALVVLENITGKRRDARYKSFWGKTSKIPSYETTLAKYEKKIAEAEAKVEANNAQYKYWNNEYKRLKELYASL